MPPYPGHFFVYHKYVKVAAIFLSLFILLNRIRQLQFFRLVFFKLLKQNVETVSSIKTNEPATHQLYNLHFVAVVCTHCINAHCYSFYMLSVAKKFCSQPAFKLIHFLSSFLLLCISFHQLILWHHSFKKVTK